jgi:16S rRNA (cytidine1402-2'-O)-methyltransferase
MTLYLLPNLLGPVKDHHFFLPYSIDEILAQIDGLIAESEGEGRRYLKHFKTKKKPHEIPIALLTKEKQDLDFLLEPVKKGEQWGVVSDCGLPCIADPGATLVTRARQLGIKVAAFTGPSSIFYALMLSGLSGQNFAFHGYIAKNSEQKAKELKLWEKIEKTTHIFIEAPYRNIQTLQACLDHLKETTVLCVAASLTLPEEFIETKTVKAWKLQNIKNVNLLIEKKPALFLFRS